MKRSGPPVFSTLSSLLSAEPISLGQYSKQYSVIHHSNGSGGGSSPNGAGDSTVMNGISLKSKRKNNPVKRELPGYAPYLTSSPDAGGASDDAGSVGSAGESSQIIERKTMKDDVALLTWFDFQKASHFPMVKKFRQKKRKKFNGKTHPVEEKQWKGKKWFEKMIFVKMKIKQVGKLP